MKFLWNILYKASWLVIVVSIWDYMGYSIQKGQHVVYVLGGVVGILIFGGLKDLFND